MGTSCAPLLADLFLYSYESEFLGSVIGGGHGGLAGSFGLCYRYIDDLIVFDNKKFLGCLKEICPSQLAVGGANKSDHLADCLGLAFVVGGGGGLSAGLCGRRDDFDFRVVGFPFLSGGVPSGPSCGVCISRLVGCARCCSHCDGFRCRRRCLVGRLLSQGCRALRLGGSFKRFCGGCRDLVGRCWGSVNAVVSGSFPGQFLFNM